jgi:polyhydroxyalkanoate synthase
MSATSKLKQRIAQKKVQVSNLSTRILKQHTLILSESTPYDILAFNDYAKVRYYPANQRKYLEPLVFVAPFAINMAIYDLFPYRSLVQHFQRQGFEVYLIEWKRFGFRDRHIDFMTIINYILPDCIHQIREHAHSEQLSLHGWSMAGIFVLLYSALQQPNFVKNLIVLGSPIDSYASGFIGKLNQAMYDFIQRNKSLEQWLFSNNIPKKFTHTPGKLNSIGFKILDPKGWYASYKTLLGNLDDLEIVKENATISKFLNNMIDYPGGINQDMIFKIWLQNGLKHGNIQLNHKYIQLNSITSSLLIGAGQTDQLVTANAIKPLCELTNSQDVTFTLIPGGHLGLMSSKASAKQFWPQLTAWLAQRSTKI